MASKIGLSLLLLSSTFFLAVRGQNTFEVLLIIETTDDGKALATQFTNGIAEIQNANDGLTIGVTQRPLDRANEESQYNDTCAELKSGQFNLVVDLTWGGWYNLAVDSKASAYPYIRVTTENHPFVQVSFI